MNQYVKHQPPAVSIATSFMSSDSLLETIDAYRKGVAAHNILVDEEGCDDDDAAVEATYGPSRRALDKWDRPAETHAGAVAALKLAAEDAEISSDEERIGCMVKAALAYFEPKQRSKETTNDPLLDAIAAYYAGNAAYDALPELTKEDEEAAIESTYGPADKALMEWAYPATSRESALAALKVALDEAELHSASDVEINMIVAAQCYFEREAGDGVDKEAVADQQRERAEQMVAASSAMADGGARRAESAKPKYDLNDVHSDIGHLYEILDVIVDSIIEDQKDRAGALAWVARDLSEHIDQKISEHFREIGSTCAAIPHTEAVAA